MAVRNKIGLDYFTFDVDFFSDEKIEFTSARFGIKGEIVAIKLLCKIYRNGYYTEWNEDESMLFAKRAGEGFAPSLVNEIVQELVKRGFFDKSLLLRFNILTSKGIQKRYFDAVERRKVVDVEQAYLLIDASKYENVNILNVNVNISPPNADILPQSKEEKEEKGKNRRAKLFTPPMLEEMIQYFDEHGYSQEHASKAFSYYDIADWKDSQGKQVRNWKQKMQSVWFKEEGKKKAVNGYKTACTPSENKW